MADTNSFDVNNSPIAQVFDAQVTTKRPKQGLYLVIGRDQSPLVAVRSVGGDVVMQINGTFTLLAVMPFTAFIALRTHPHIRHIGSITLDKARFEQFAAAAGLDIVPGQNNPSG